MSLCSMHDFVYDYRAGPLAAGSQVSLQCRIIVYLKSPIGNYRIAGKKRPIGLLPMISHYLSYLIHSNQNADVHGEHGSASLLRGLV